LDGIVPTVSNSATSEEGLMADTLDTLIADMLQWLDAEPRSYAEVMDVWRTSCPKLTVWENAVDRGFVSRECRDGKTWILVTIEGRAFLAGTRRASEGYVGAVPSSYRLLGLALSRF
jgi:hypothetical protein